MSLIMAFVERPVDIKLIWTLLDDGALDLALTQSLIATRRHEHSPAINGHLDERSDPTYAERSLVPILR